MGVWFVAEIRGESAAVSIPSSALDEVLVDASGGREAGYLAIRRLDRQTREAELVVRSVSASNGRIVSLPELPFVKEYTDSVSVHLAASELGPCVQYGTEREDVASQESRLACLFRSSQNPEWQPVADFSASVNLGETVEAIAVRGAVVYVALTNQERSEVRVVRLGLGAARSLGSVMKGEEMYVDFNEPIDAFEQVPSLTVELNHGRGYGIRIVRKFQSDRWVHGSSPLKTIYPSQSGGAARSAGKWLISATRSLPERGISGYSILSSQNVSRKWRALAPRNIAATSGFSQGSVASAGQRVWTAWSEQGRISREGVPIRVYAAPISNRRSRVGKRRLLWRGAVRGFPPVPRVISLGKEPYVAFEQARGAESNTRVLVKRLD